MKKQNMLYGMLIIACGMPGAYGGCPYSQPQCTSSYIQMLNNTSGFNRDNCTSYTNLCHSTVGMVGYIDCSSCKSGYKAVQKTYSTQMGCGNITVTECLPCAGCSNCDSYYDSYAECYRRLITRKCDCETCKTVSTGSYECYKNCYGSYDGSQSEPYKRCKWCPGAPGDTIYPTMLSGISVSVDYVNSDAGATSNTQCYIQNAATGKDSSGSFQIVGKCYFSPN